MNNDSKIIKNLIKTGLDEKSALVYLTLLRLKSAKPSVIAQETSLNRSTVYKILFNLVSINLISENKQSKNICYQVERPEKLISFARNELKTAENKLDNAERIMPFLFDIYNNNL